MSKFIDNLNRLRQGEPQPIGFRAAKPASSKARIQLVASLARESIEGLADNTAGADAGLLRASKPGPAGKTLEKVSQSAPDIPWGVWLQGVGQKEIKQITKAGCDFIVFPATTPLAMPQNDEMGKILEVEASLTEGMLRAANELPVDAVLIASEGKEGFLTWQHLMLFRRFADLLTIPLLVSIPASVTADELQSLWEAGVSGLVAEINEGQPQDRIKELRQAIDKLTFPSPRKREKTQPLLPRVSRETGTTSPEEEEEEEDE